MKKQILQKQKIIINICNSKGKNEEEENFFQEHIKHKIEETPKTRLHPQVMKVMKNLQALYNADANKIVEQDVQENSTKEIFSIDQSINAMVAEDIMPTESPKCSTKPRIIIIQNHKENSKMPYEKTSTT